MQYSKIMATLILSGGVTAAHAGIIDTYSDKADFLALAGAGSLTGAIPATGSQGNTVTLGDVTLSTQAFPDSSSIIFGGPSGEDYWSSLIPGNDIAISGAENLDIGIELGGAVTAFGFDFHEPSTVRSAANDTQQDTTNTANFHDSTFAITLLSGSTVIDETFFAPANDALLFFGVRSDTAFDTVRIVEDRSGSSDRFGRNHNIDNEFFGEFYAAPVRDVTVPEPGTLALLGACLMGLGLRRGPAGHR